MGKFGLISEHLQARRVITVEFQDAASTTACLDRVRVHGPHPYSIIEHQEIELR